MNRNLEMRPLITAEEIKQRVHQIAAQIDQDFPQQEVLLVGVLKGCFIFLADLIRAIKNPVQVEFMGVASYIGTESSGHVRITHDLAADIQNKNVILVEDIVDSGTTIDYLLSTLRVRDPKKLKVCALLSKREAHAMAHQLDYVGFEIDRKFVVGYGLDLDGAYRGLPEIMQVKT